MDETSIQQVCCCERGSDGGKEVRSGSKGEGENGGKERAEKEGCRCGNKNGWIRQEVRETHAEMEVLRGTDLFFK